MRMNQYRSVLGSTLTEEDLDREVIVSGWVENIRDHGGVIFVDLREEKGIIQLVGHDDTVFMHLTKESVICVKGKVRKRSEEDYNPKIATGTIEILTEKLAVLSKAKNILPFEIMKSKEVKEEVRLKYRYLDLRNKEVHDTIILRSEVLKYLRKKMDSFSFIEVQTPILTASSPEGARDFLVPSRKFPGKFYALPQAPQVFKELLMVGGFDRYYQIAPCFRDEDCRADRTLEFYQLDFEMAFAEVEDVYMVGEEILRDTFGRFSHKKISSEPFKRITYKEAMLTYGTDKPDLRNPLEIIDITEELKETSFKPFQNSIIRGIVVDGIGDRSNTWFNEIVDYANSIGMPGIGYITLLENGDFKGPIDKFLTEKERECLKQKTHLKKQSVLFFIADKKEVKAAHFAGQIRTKLGQKLSYIDENTFAFCIVHDFPLFEYDEETMQYDFGHNPFSLPQGGLEALEKENMDTILAYQYDFVCNGYEMASGAVRNHDIECLEKAFTMVGYEKGTVEKKFNALYNAFQYGAPPHAGMALGIDRILMLLKDEKNLREVVAFPLTVSGQDAMMCAPTSVSEKQLREIHIKLR